MDEWINLASASAPTDQELEEELGEAIFWVAGRCGFDVAGELAGVVSHMPLGQRLACILAYVHGREGMDAARELFRSGDYEEE